MVTVEKVIDYWFLNYNEIDNNLDKQMEFWFRRGDDIDDEVRLNFSSAVESAASGRLNNWHKTDLGWLAFIILIDQFPRNIYRGKAESYALDSLALSISLKGIKKSRDLSLPVVARPYIYLPLMHSEDFEIQKLSLELSKKLYNEATLTQRKFIEVYLESALEHYQIIREFGRYPHRNEILGRKSTEKELNFLEKSDFLTRV